MQVGRCCPCADVVDMTAIITGVRFARCTVMHTPPSCSIPCRVTGNHALLLPLQRRGEVRPHRSFKLWRRCVRAPRWRAKSPSPRARGERILRVWHVPCRLPDSSRASILHKATVFSFGILRVSLVAGGSSWQTARVPSGVWFTSHLESCGPLHLETPSTTLWWTHSFSGISSLPLSLLHAKSRDQQEPRARARVTESNKRARRAKD
jgi:hypothetical protein